MANDCPFHYDHENRIKRVESEVKEVNVKMDKLESNQKDPRWFMAILSLIGVIFSAVGSIIGMFIIAYLKTKGVL